jgi:hypothetical protein
MGSTFYPIGLNFMLSIPYNISLFLNILLQYTCLLFLFVYNRLGNLSVILWLSPSLVTGLHIKSYVDHLLFLAVRVLLRPTPVVTQDFGLYGLIRRTGPHVPHMDSNPRGEDDQNFMPSLYPHQIRSSNHRSTLATYYCT